MNGRTFTPLCAAIIAGALTTHAPAQHTAPAPLTPEEPAASAEGESPAPSSSAAHQSPSLESQALGRPKRLLSSFQSTADGDEEAKAPHSERGRAGTLFGSIGHDIWQVLSALAIVLGLLLLLRAVLLRSGRLLTRGGRPSGVLEVLARYPIARGQHLVLLKLARRILLVHQSGSAMTTLSEMSDADEVASLLARIEAGSTSPREASRFRSLLEQFSREHDRATSRADHTGIEDAWDTSEIVDLTRRPRRGFKDLFSRPARATSR